MPMSLNSGIVAFSADQVRRLTGLSLRQLAYWDKTGFFSPEHAPGYRAGAFSRVYSFRDVVGLYTIALLRKRHRFPLQQLRRVGEYLHRHHETPWAGLALFIAGREVLFRDPTDPTDYISAAPKSPGQRVIPVYLEEVAGKVRDITEGLRRRPKELVGQIVRNRYVVHNAPVLAGTRIPTAAVWNFFAAGYTTSAILREYPRLKPRDVVAAIGYEKGRRAAALR
jgi:uncharacterized protein (DUF433 family)